MGAACREKPVPYAVSKPVLNCPEENVDGSSTGPEGTVQEPSMFPLGPPGTVLGAVYVVLGHRYAPCSKAFSMDSPSHGPSGSLRNAWSLALSGTAPKEAYTASWVP